MKKIKFLFSVAIFTLLTVFVFLFFMGVVYLQPLDMHHPGRNQRHHQITESIKKEIENKRKEAENKRKEAILLQMKLKRIKKEKEENKTLTAFSRLSGYENDWKRYWFSPIMLGLKEITVDQGGKKIIYKLDKIAQTIKRNSGARKEARWTKNHFEYMMGGSDFSFTEIKGEGRKQLLSLLEKGTGKPLGIITNTIIEEYQKKFFNAIRPHLIKLKNSRDLKEWLNWSIVVTANDEVTNFYFWNLMRTENLETISYENLDNTSKSHFLRITTGSYSFEGAVRVFHKAIIKKHRPIKVPLIVSKSKLLSKVKFAPSSFAPFFDKFAEMTNVSLQKNHKTQPIFHNSANIKFRINNSTSQQKKLTNLGNFSQKMFDKVKEKTKPLLQNKMIKTQSKIALTENFETKKLKTTTKSKLIIKTQLKNILIENLEIKKKKIIKESGLQTKEKTTKLIGIFSVASGVFTFSTLSTCLYWSLKDKKIILSLSFLQN